jgi:primosomal replication protein N
MRSMIALVAVDTCRRSRCRRLTPFSGCIICKFPAAHVGQEESADASRQQR